MIARTGSKDCGPDKTERKLAKMTQKQLASRWHMSPRTLEQWRWLGKGPRFLKIGARVLYDEADIEVFEAAQRCQNTHGPLPLEGG